jgi:hypothetical protein
MGGVEVWLRSFLTSAIEAGEWSSRSGHFTPGKNSGTHGVCGWVDIGADPDVSEETTSLSLAANRTDIPQCGM